MAKNSLFSGGQRSVANKRGASGRRPAAEATDLIEALEKAKANDLILPDVSFTVERPCVYYRTQANCTFVKNFSPLAERYPHHGTLIKHLLLGAGLRRTRLRIAYAELSSLYNSIWEFVECLNQAPIIDTVVRDVADISPHVCRSFSLYLTSTYPQRTTNSSIYREVEQTVQSLKERYAHAPDIGPIFPWPRGPRTTSKSAVAYSTNEYRELMKCCEHDLRAIMATHKQYLVLKEHGEQIRGDEFNFENIMWWMQSTPHNRERCNIVDRRFVRDFCRVEDLTVDDLLVIYRADGQALASRGQNPFGHHFIVDP